MTASIRGIIEGFYGTPWTWDQRIDVCRFVAERGMTHYVYAPKDDPKHRRRWRELYSASKLVGFDRLVAESGLTVGYAIAPGLDIAFGDSADRKALFVKVDQVVDLGVPLVMLALDDIPFDPGAGPAHAALTADLAEHLDGRATVVLVPTEYVGMNRTPYLDALAELVPPAVAIGWTGAAVVNDHITAEQARQRSEALGGRPPLLWDNYPVNDGFMTDRLFMGPLWGREPELVQACCGYLANPMVQPRASLLPLASIAAWLRGEDPVGAWADEAGPLRIFAEACDGAVPQVLVRSAIEGLDGPEWPAAIAPLVEWLAAAAECEAPGLKDEAGEWVAQVRREARLGLSALRLVQHGRPHVVVDDAGHGRVTPPQPAAALQEVFNLVARWPRVRRADKTVMGPRCSFRPLLAQRADGGWRVDRTAIDVNQNAIDQVVEAALDLVDGLPDLVDPVEVLLNGETVQVAADGTFAVPAGAEIVTASGWAHTTQQAPCGPPVASPA